MDSYFTLFVVVVALTVATGGVLLLVGYIATVPASFAVRWYWAVATVFLPPLGNIAFCIKLGKDWNKTKWQLIAGTVLTLAGAGALYAAGPWFAARALAMEAAAHKQTAAATAPAPVSGEVR